MMKTVKNAMGINLNKAALEKEIKEVNNSLVRGVKYDKIRIEEITNQIKEYQTISEEKSEVLSRLMFEFYIKRQLYFISLNYGAWDFIKKNTDKNIKLGEIIGNCTGYKLQTAEEIQKELKENFLNLVEYISKFNDKKEVLKEVERQVGLLKGLALCEIMEQQASEKETEELLGF